MQVSVENTGTLGRRMTVAIPAQEVEEKVQARLRNIAKSAKLPGFRPGKAPLKILDAHYGKQVLLEVAGSLMETGFEEACNQEKVFPAVTPEIEPTDIKRGQNVEFTASFDVFPEVPRLDLEGVEIERPVCEITEQDIDRTVQSMRRQKTSYRPVDRAAKDGDRVRVNFTGSIGGEPFAGGEARDYELVLGEGQFLEPFEKGILGASAGEQRSVTAAVPGDHHAVGMAGKEVQFDVRVNEVAEPELPEVNEEFVKSFGIDSGGMDAFRREIVASLERERDERISQLTRSRVMDALIAHNDIEVPAKLVEREIHGMIEMNKSLLARQGIPVDDRAPEPESYRAGAHRRVKLGLILSEIVQHLELKPDQDKVRERIERMAASYDQPEQLVQWYYSNHERVQQVESTVLEEQVVDRLLATANQKDQTMSLPELTVEVGAS